MIQSSKQESGWVPRKVKENEETYDSCGDGALRFRFRQHGSRILKYRRLKVENPRIYWGIWQNRLIDTVDYCKMVGVERAIGPNQRLFCCL
jgi:hypothetical protein